MNGRLDLKFTRKAHATSLHVNSQQPPLRIVRAFPRPHGDTLVHLHNLSGGVLGGDHLSLKLEVGPQAAAQVTSTGATRVYRCRAGASQAIEVTVGEGGMLEYVPDALIPFAGSRYRQETRIELGPGAGLFWWEIVAPGREARGELFAYGRLEFDFTITACGTPIAIERSRIKPEARPPASLARLGPYRYWASFYVCRVGVEPRRWLELERELQSVAQHLTRPSESLWVVSALCAEGLTVRALAVSGRHIAPGLATFWRAASLALYGREPVPPRKLQ